MEINWLNHLGTEPALLLHWTSMSTFFISWSLKLSGAEEHTWNAAQRHNFWVLHVKHPKPSLAMLSSCCPTLRYSCEMLLWGAFPAPNHGIFGPHVNILMKTSYHLNPIKVCEVLLWSFSPKADVQNRSGEPFLQGEIALYHPAERAWFPPHHQMTKGRKNVSQLEGSGGSADIWKTAAKADLQALHLW